MYNPAKTHCNYSYSYTPLLTRQYLKMSGQFHAPAALPSGERAPAPIEYTAGCSPKII